MSNDAHDHGPGYVGHHAKVPADDPAGNLVAVPQAEHRGMTTTIHLRRGEPIDVSHVYEVMKWQEAVYGQANVEIVIEGGSSWGKSTDAFGPSPLTPGLAAFLRTERAMAKLKDSVAAAGQAMRECSRAIDKAHRETFARLVDARSLRRRAEVDLGSARALLDAPRAIRASDPRLATAVDAACPRVSRD